MLDSLKSQSFFGNTLFDYALVVGWIALGLIALWIIKTVVLHRLKKLSQKTDTKIDDAIVALTNRFIVPLLYFGVFLYQHHWFEFKSVC